MRRPKIIKTSFAPPVIYVRSFNPIGSQRVTSGEPKTSTFDVVRTSARAHAPDRFYAALFAQAEARADLIALAAFSGEIERISRQVSEAALGEIRVAWWRDAFLSRG